MSSGLKKLLSFLLIALSITAVFFIAFSNEDLTNASDTDQNITEPNETDSTETLKSVISTRKKTPRTRLKKQRLP